MSAPETVETEHDVKRAKARRLAWLVLRLAVAAIALYWTLSRVALSDMTRAASRIGVSAALFALALGYANMILGAVRWRAMLGAYGARVKPSVWMLARIYLVSTFYNTFLPGNVGGDVLRGHVTRNAFGGGAAAYMVVAIERVFGLAGLLVLGASVIAVHPVGGIEGLGRFAVVGLLLALLAALSPIVGRRVAPRFRGRVGELLSALPVVERPLLLLAALVCSVGTQTVVALTGHALIVSIDPGVALADSLVLVPIALIAVYFPATVAGLGVREAAFVVLFTEVGVARADATAASLAFLAISLVVAATGGLAHVLFPLRDSDLA